jgi:hypothetical protein
MASLFLTGKDVQQLTGLAKTAAHRRLTEVRKVFNIPKYQQVNIQEYCTVYRLDVELVLKQLNEKWM